jgi:hypothetical protein
LIKERKSKKGEKILKKTKIREKIKKIGKKIEKN